MGPGRGRDCKQASASPQTLALDVSFEFKAMSKKDVD